MACLIWLVLASVSLFLLAKNIEITLDGQPSNFKRILLLPYSYRSAQSPDVAQLKDALSEDVEDDKSRWVPERHMMTEFNQGQSYPRRTGTPQSDVNIFQSPSMAPFESRPLLHTSQTAVGIPEKSFTVTITMHKEVFWHWWEAGIETMAVGVYLYATIVLGSTLFLTGQSSIEYTVLMVLSLAVIRIVGTVV